MSMPTTTPTNSDDNTVAADDGATSAGNGKPKFAFATGTLTSAGDGKPAFIRAIVPVPVGVQPGQEFQACVGKRVVSVRCPDGCSPGQSLQISFPVDPVKSLPPPSTNAKKQEDGAYIVTVPDEVGSGQKFPLTLAGQTVMVTLPPNARPGSRVRVVPPPPPPNQDVPVDPAKDAKKQEDGAYIVTVPDGVLSGQSFPVTLAGRTLVVTAPPNARPGTRLRVVPPAPPRTEATQLFEVHVPESVRPGRPFSLLAGGVHVLITCPNTASAGQRIRFKLPSALTQSRCKSVCDNDGWTRVLRVCDFKFQWVRLDDKGVVVVEDDSSTRFNPEKSAFVRQFRNGDLHLVRATKAALLDSRVLGNNGAVLVTSTEICHAYMKPFEDKVKWFEEKCLGLCVERADGHMRLNVRRDFLLKDSMDAVMSLSGRDLRKPWRFEFVGESGIDEDGFSRDWFQLAAAEIFDPDMGLWQSKEDNQWMMMINPSSTSIHDYLLYYRFLGRLLGKALLDRQLVAWHMVPFVYKHILGWPVAFKDMEMVDEKYYDGLKKLRQWAEAGKDVSVICLDFTTTQEVYGVKEQIDLVENGADVEVNNDNFLEYLEACFEYRMMGQIRQQLNELLLGFFDVIPEPLVTAFDFQELELLMCGPPPKIDLEDWKEHTEYSGEYHEPTVRWFWEVVKEFDQETKARLLQFVTGTSAGVPRGGFGVLQGYGQSIRKFTIRGVSLDTCLFPRTHPDFNRIDLPRYETKTDLREKLKIALANNFTGFNIA